MFRHLSPVCPTRDQKTIYVLINYLKKKQNDYLKKYVPSLLAQHLYNKKV